MANALTIITVLHDPAREEVTVTAPLSMPTGEYRRELQQLGEFFSAAAGGQRACSVRVAHETGGDKTLAAQTITLSFADITADTDTLTIGGVVFTWKAAASTESEVTIGANLAAATTNLTAALNAHSKLTGLFTATGVTATGVVTLTANFPGRLFNLITLATNDATAMVLGAAVMAGGTGTTLMATRLYGAGVVGS